MSTKETWAKRVRRQESSGRTVKEFAAEIGVNANTLSHWKWKLGREAGSKGAGHGEASSTFVEVTSMAASSWWHDGERIELVVDDRHLVRVPDGFDAETLRRVLEVVDGRR